MYWGFISFRKAIELDRANSWGNYVVHQKEKFTNHHSPHVKIKTLNVKAAIYLELIVLFKIGKITLLILDEENDIFLLIFDAMRTFSASDEVQKLGCKVLHVLFERGI